MTQRWLLLCALTMAGCTPKAPTPQDALDRRFQEMMNGVTMVGRSSRLNSDKISGEERYTIEKVSKLTGDTWLFQARMKIGSTDMPVPVPVTIKWAGDTPVITLTDLAIPGMGSYTARIVLYRDQYAGTWSGQKGGGQMFGKLVRGK